MRYLFLFVLVLVPNLVRADKLKFELLEPTAMGELKRNALKVALEPQTGGSLSQSAFDAGVRTFVKVVEHMNRKKEILSRHDLIMLQAHALSSVPTVMIDPERQEKRLYIHADGARTIETNKDADARSLLDIQGNPTKSRVVINKAQSEGELELYRVQLDESYWGDAFENEETIELLQEIGHAYIQYLYFRADIFFHDFKKVFTSKIDKELFAKAIAGELEDPVQEPKKKEASKPAEELVEPEPRPDIDLTLVKKAMVNVVKSGKTSQPSFAFHTVREYARLSDKLELTKFEVSEIGIVSELWTKQSYANAVFTKTPVYSITYGSVVGLVSEGKK